MVQKGSIIKSGDNSGISFLNCIGILSKRKESKIFDFIKFSIKKFSKFKKRRIIKVKKSEVYKGLIMSTNSFLYRKNGFFLKFDIIRSIGLKDGKLLGSLFYINTFKEIKNLLLIKKKRVNLIRKIILKSKFIL